jgi:tRNA G37 N-methylase Trm5
VLIPRPETELLVEKALLRLPEDEDLRVLDLGTGSGAVSLAIAKERPRVTVIGVDVSLAALDVARLNARLQKIDNVEFRESNWFDAVRGEKFHVVVGNPPYVAEDDPHLGQATRASSRGWRWTPARAAWSAFAPSSTARTTTSSARAGCCSSTARPSTCPCAACSRRSITTTSPSTRTRPGTTG